MRPVAAGLQYHKVVEVLNDSLGPSDFKGGLIMEVILQGIGSGIPTYPEAVLRRPVNCGIVTVTVVRPLIVVFDR
jgi:hypothetical protein